MARPALHRQVPPLLVLEPPRPAARHPQQTLALPVCLHIQQWQWPIFVALFGRCGLLCLACLIDAHVTRPTARCLRSCSARWARSLKASSRTLPAGEQDHAFLIAHISHLGPKRYSKCLLLASVCLRCLLFLHSVFRFPHLLTTCYFFALRWCASEPVFQKYFSASAMALLDTLAPAAIHAPPPPLPETVPEGLAAAAVAEVMHAANAVAASAVAASMRPHSANAGYANQQHRPVMPTLQQQQQQEQQLVCPSTEGNSSMPPSRPGSIWMDECGAAAVLSSPPRALLAPGQLPLQALPPAGALHDEEGTMPIFPLRPGQPVCDFYQKTGALLLISGYTHQHTS